MQEIKAGQTYQTISGAIAWVDCWDTVRGIWVGSVQDSQKAQPPFFCTWLDDGSESTGIRGHLDLDLDVEACEADTRQQSQFEPLHETFDRIDWFRSNPDRG